MELIRLAVASITGILVVGGYFASLAAYFGGTTTDYIDRLDNSMIPVLALVLIAAVTILAFIPSQEEAVEESE